MLKLNLSKQSRKFLETLVPKHARQIAVKISELRNNPRPQDTKQLKGYEDYWRAESGEYRIIYRTENETLCVVIVGKRNDDDVYQKLSRH